MFIINKITFFFLRTIKIFLNSVLIKYLFLSSFIVTLIKVSKSNNKWWSKSTLLFLLGDSYR